MSRESKCRDVRGVREDRVWPGHRLVESLEARRLLSAVPVARPAVDFKPAGTGSNASAFTPTQIRQAYGFDQIDFGTDGGSGSGQTIALIEAYASPTIRSDLSRFDDQFGLGAPPSFTQVNQAGGTRLPKFDPDWSMETSLDVEWAHAVAPNANLLLVDANSANLGDLLSAVDYARHASGVSAISMSWGGSEFPQQVLYDGLFTTPAGHDGITFVAASGDRGSASGPQWPASSPNVLAVGGTTLNPPSASGAYAGEVGWSESGGGVSRFENEPFYQSAAQQAGARSSPDVSYDADPRSGYAVYDSVLNDGHSGWWTVGGTSAGAPQWAGLIAIADEGRSLNHLGPLDGRTQTIPSLYAMSSSAFHDVTSGQSSPLYFAGVGYDMVTGRGSPVAFVIVVNLSGSPHPAAAGPGLLPGGESFKTERAEAAEGTPPPITIPSATNQPAPAPVHSLTVLAQTPAALANPVPSTGPTAVDSPSLTVGPAVTNQTSTASIQAVHLPASFGTVAAVMPAGTLYGAVAGESARSVSQVAGKIADAVAGIVSPQSLSGEVMYNFVQFNPAAMLNDAIAAFANESASLSTSTAASGNSYASSTRAWAITAAVIGFDLVFMSCWYQKTRQEKSASLKRVRGWGVEVDPCQERLL